MSPRTSGGEGRTAAAMPQLEAPRIHTTVAWDALGALDAGVLLLDAGLHVLYANARWDTWTGEPVAVGTAFHAMLVDPGETGVLTVTLCDGTSRSTMMALRSTQSSNGARQLNCVVRRIGEGLLLVEASHDPDGDGLAMHDVARRLSEVSDMAEVLGTLCEIAMRQCHATGAAVLRMSTTTGEIVASAGDLVAVRGRCFESDGSMMMEALAHDAVVGEQEFSGSGRPLMRAVPDLAVGPVMVAPLRAHGDSLGVLAITRRKGGRPFTEVDGTRLRLLADHAALAVHKTLLLQQAQAADHAKGRFLATMSHELRTPLTALAGYGELLADQVIGPLSEPQLDILDRMRSVTTHLSAMIEEILAFTSLEDGRETVRPTEFLVEDLVRSAAAVVEPLALQKGITLVVSLPAGSVRMTSDIDKARQILVNLLGNAVKFTDTGSVTITLARHERAVRLTVLDTGIGIPTDELPRLFRPFAQVDTGLTRRHGGTGLGLYISRRLASLLGGHIEVESRVESGSAFTVVLPLVRDVAR